jgi:hypothetical protein
MKRLLSSKEHSAISLKKGGFGSVWRVKDQLTFRVELGFLQRLNSGPGIH